jgi:hypothetical protein
MEAVVIQRPYTPFGDFQGLQVITARYFDSTTVMHVSQGCHTLGDGLRFLSLVVHSLGRLDDFGLGWTAPGTSAPLHQQGLITVTRCKTHGVAVAAFATAA